MSHRANEMSLQQRMEVVLTKVEMLTVTIARPNVFSIGYGWVTYRKTCSAKGSLENTGLLAAYMASVVRVFITLSGLISNFLLMQPQTTTFFFSGVPTGVHTVKQLCLLALDCLYVWPPVLNWPAEDGT